MWRSNIKDSNKHLKKLSLASPSWLPLLLEYRPAQKDCALFMSLLNFKGNVIWALWKKLHFVSIITFLPTTAHLELIYFNVSLSGWYGIYLCVSKTPVGGMHEWTKISIFPQLLITGLYLSLSLAAVFLHIFHWIKQERELLLGHIYHFLIFIRNNIYLLSLPAGVYLTGVSWHFNSTNRKGVNIILLEEGKKGSLNEKDRCREAKYSTNTGEVYKKRRAVNGQMEKGREGNKKLTYFTRVPFMCIRPQHQ